MNNLEKRVDQLEKAYEFIFSEMREIKELLNPRLVRVETDLKWLKQNHKQINERIFFAGILLISAINLVLTLIK